MIDTIFPKTNFPGKNTRFIQCSWEFYDFTENVIFAAAKKTFFVMAFPTRFSAFEGGKTGRRTDDFCPRRGRRIEKMVKTLEKRKKRATGDEGNPTPSLVCAVQI